MKFLRILVIVLLFAFIALVCVHSLGSINQDIGRHLKLGQIIWETKSVPKINLFSFTEPDYPFINHHWLSEVVFYLLFGIIGLKGLIIFKAAIVAVSFWLIYKAADKKTGLWPFLVSAPLGILVFLNRSDVRPEIFSYLFLAFFVFAILRAKYAEERWSRSPRAIEDPRYRPDLSIEDPRQSRDKAISGLYALPFVQILWNNAHIYFVLGPALLLFFLIDAALDKERRVALSKIFWIFLATSAATILNPNFIKGALAPFFILRNYGYTIVENQSIFFLKDYGIQSAAINVFEISLIILIISFVIALKNGGRRIVFEFLAGLAFSILAVKMIRNTGIYALVFTSVTALNLSTIKPAVRFLKRPGRIIFYLALSAIFAFFIINVLNNNFRTWMQEGGKFGLEIPAGAARGVEFVRQNNIKGPVFNNFDVGSFLIWKLYPEQKVFVDGRPEAYSVEFFENIYKPMQEDPALWKKYSEIYKINYIFFSHTDITPWARKFLYSISLNTDWPLVYKDGSVAIFLKRTPENSALIKKFEIKK